MLYIHKILSKNVSIWGLPLISYILLAGAMTWPLVTQLTTHLPGGAHEDGLEDAYQNVWNLWWTQEALFSLQHPFITDRLFHPERPGLFYHSLSLATMLPMVFITWRWGPIASFNVMALLSFIVGALGMWALARDRTGSNAGALLAGIVYAGSPFRMAVLVTDGQLEMAAQHWLPWYVLFLLRVIEQGQQRQIMLAALFLTLAAWTSWYYMLFLLLFTASYAIWFVCWRAGSWKIQRRTMIRLVIIGLLAGIGIAPLFLPMLIEVWRYGYMYDYPPTDPERLSADLLAYLVPPDLHTLWGSAPWDWGIPYTLTRRFYLGAIALVLALGAVWREPAARRWGLVALAAGVLSLGPILQIGDISTGLPLPYRLLSALPLINISRQPDRFNVMVTLALGVIVAYGTRLFIAWMVSYPTKRAWQCTRSGTGNATWRVTGALTTLLSALLIIDYWPAPIATRQPFVPPFLVNLTAKDTTTGALLEYPFHTDRPYRDAERMLFQTIHEHPISGGYLSRPYPQTQLGLPVLRDLQAGQINSDIVLEPDTWRGALNTLNYDYLIGYKQRPMGPQSLEPDEVEAFRHLVNQGLAVTGPDYEDEWVIVYRVPPATPQPIVQIGLDWEPVEELEDGTPYRWLAVQAELDLIVPAAGTYQVSFDAWPAGSERHLVLTLPNEVLELPLTPEERRYTLVLTLPAGRTTLQLQTIEPPVTGVTLGLNLDTRPISVRFANMVLEGAVVADRCDSP